MKFWMEVTLRLRTGTTSKPALQSSNSTQLFDNLHSTLDISTSRLVRTASAVLDDVDYPIHLLEDADATKYRRAR